LHLHAYLVSYVITEFKINNNLKFIKVNTTQDLIIRRRDRELYDWWVLMRPKTERKHVKLSSLRLLTKRTLNDSIYFEQERFVIKDAHALTPTTIKALLELMPLIVTESRDKKLYDVVFGSRLFCIAAQILEPNEEIQIEIIQVAKGEEVEQLRYLDLVIIPVLHTLSLTASETYNLINVSKKHIKMWQVPSKAAFADVLGVSRSLLSAKPKIRKSGDTCDEQSPSA